VAVEAGKAVGRFTKARQFEALLETVLRESPKKPGSTPSVPSPASKKALAKIRILGMGYTAKEAIQEVQSRAQECPGLDAEALPGLLFALMDRETGAAVEAAHKALEYLIRNPALPDYLKLFLRLQAALRKEEWNAVASLSEECLRHGFLGESGISRPEGLLYRLLLPPVDLGQGMNADINQAFLSDLRGDGPDGGRSLLGRHCLFASAKASMSSGRPSEALNTLPRLGGIQHASVPKTPLQLEAALSVGDKDLVLTTCRTWFQESPLDTRAWERIHSALGQVGGGPESNEFLKSMHVLALYYLDGNQAERIERLLQPIL
jgi:hypothetical protein